MTEADDLLAQAEEAIEAWLCELDAEHHALLDDAVARVEEARSHETKAAAALEQAQRTASELVTAADEHAGRIMAQARNTSEELVAAAREEARRIVDDAEAEAERRLDAARAAVERAEAEAAADAAALASVAPIRRRGLRRIFGRG